MQSVPWHKDVRYNDTFRIGPNFLGGINVCGTVQIWRVRRKKRYDANKLWSDESQRRAREPGAHTMVSTV